jgi:hypothetical protein
MMVFMIFPVQTLVASEGTLYLANVSDGNRLTAMPLRRPFWVVMKNTSDRSFSIMDWELQISRNRNLSFTFKTEQGESIPIRIAGGISITWNPGRIIALSSGKSFAIKADFSEGGWINLNRLNGKMEVVVTYDNSFFIDPASFRKLPGPLLPPGLKSEIKSEPLSVTIER